MNFKLFLEELRLRRMRNVKKAFSKIYKKGKTEKFKPGTFGFDIEFDYEEEPIEMDVVLRISKFIDGNRNETTKRYEWIKDNYSSEEFENDDASDAEYEYAEHLYKNVDECSFDIPESNFKLKRYESYLKDLDQSVKYSIDKYDFTKDWVLSVMQEDNQKYLQRF